MLDRRGFVIRMLPVGILALAGVPAMAYEAPQQTPGKKYVCPPCPCGEDHKEHDAPGACPACGMPLVEKTAGQPAPVAKPQSGAGDPSSVNVAAPAGTPQANPQSPSSTPP